jgi:AcrR family transcriptional regulator
MTANRRGRRLDPAVSQAALDATMQLLAERGYAGLHVGDVADRAGIGLGALYRRWPTKRELVVCAIRALAAEQELPTTEDPVADLRVGLEEIANALAGPHARLLADILAAPDDPELAAAVREAKLAPLLASHRERLRRVLGDVPDLDARAELGPALILFRTLALGRVPTGAELRDEILPLMLGGR